MPTLRSNLLDSASTLGLLSASRFTGKNCLTHVLNDATDRVMFLRMFKEVTVGFWAYLADDLFSDGLIPAFEGADALSSGLASLLSRFCLWSWAPAPQDGSDELPLVIVVMFYGNIQFRCAVRWKI